MINRYIRCSLIQVFLLVCFVFNFKLDGIETFGQEKVKINENVLTQEKSVPSLHVLIATVGRNSLMRMLNSLKPQLGSQDYLTVVFDAVDRENIYSRTVAYLAEFECKCSVIMEPVNLGYWGHAIRNKHNQLPGDFILAR